MTEKTRIRIKRKRWKKIYLIEEITQNELI